MVLADYRTNPDTINHAVVKMLHRVSVDLKMTPLLYQLSVFRTMQAILHEPATGRYKVRMSISSLSHTPPLLPSPPHTITLKPLLHHHSLTHHPSPPLIPSSPHTITLKPLPHHHSLTHHPSPPLIPSPLVLMIVLIVLQTLMECDN